MSTKYRGSPEIQRALNLFICLTRASESFQRSALHRAPLPESLTLSQFAVLEALYHLGPMSQNRVAQKVLKTKGNVSLVVRRLVEHGLVTCARDGDDRRQNVLQLSERGRTLIASYFPKIAAGFARGAEVLSPEEQQLLIDLAKKLGHGQNA